MRIIVTGDIHIGKRSSAIEGDALFLSTKYTWEQIVDYALNNAVDLVVLTGDIVDRENRFFEAVSPLRKGLQRLADHHVVVAMVAGNHDYDVLPEIVKTVDRSHIFLLGTKGDWEEQVVTIGDRKIRLIGWSFTHPDQTEDPLKTFPAEKIRQEELFTLGILHGDTQGQASRYAPINSAVLKETQGVDAWLLGHIHKPEVISAAHPLILYPGSPHALSPKETGIHGPYLLEWKDGEWQIQQLSFSPVRYESLSIDISDVTHKEHFRQKTFRELDQFAQELKDTERLEYLVYDVELRGESNYLREFHQWGADEIQMYGGSQPFQTKIRKVSLQINPIIQIESFYDDPSYMGVLARAIRALESGEEDNHFVNELKKEWDERFEALWHSTIYQPLSAPVDQEEKMRTTLLKECKRLFTELYNLRIYES
ncbi:DNA repair exonuclease [Parabacteroides sp. PF5-6]|uniref:metallophosphoesterase family protein n=1 Tax=Parabacteroides sp. PF5-6 TaxID=1742403 RepID=UPI002406E962|nr:DNA repair exonuclease [Parabacteroides sp. PF5-6]MDF9830975.1 exonuclease SbcD [Parabacteroides sp. PF5-6]